MSDLLPVSAYTDRLYRRLPQLYRDADALGANLAASENLLTWDEASMLSARTDLWAPLGADLDTVAPVASPVGRDGTRSLAVTQTDLTSGNDLGVVVARAVPVIAGQSYSIFASTQGPTGALSTVTGQFFDLYGDVLLPGATGPSGTSTEGSPGSWADLADIFVAPEGAVAFQLQVNWRTVPLGETHYTSRLGVFPGGLWTSWPPADGSWPLLRYLALLGDQAGELETLLDRFNYPGGNTTCDLTDPRTADPAWLPWLAQLVGVQIPPSVTDPAAARGLIAGAASGWRAGTTDALAAAVRTVLTGGRYVQINDHYLGDPWKIEIRTRTTETPTGSPDPVLVAAAPAKPAGVVLVHTSYQATWAVLEAAYPTWADWEAGDPI